MNIKLIIVTAICLNIVACGGGGSGTSGGNNGPYNPPAPTPATPTPVPTSGNFAHILISQGNSGICNNINIPCVSVTICQPGNPNNCDTVNNILVDTGSYGLRVFRSLLTNTGNSLVTMQSGGSSVAECVSYADGHSNWGPVQYAVVNMGGISTVESIPIQVLSTSFPGAQNNCPGADSTPEQFGLNGIIGVGPWQTDAGVSRYYACNNGNCTFLAPPPAYVTNPIIKFPSGNNNGLTLVFGSVAQSGVTGADGYAIFGVASVPSNTPGAVNVFQIETSNNNIPINVDSFFQGQTYSSFLDTGSNFLYFDNAFLALCPYNVGLFCPSGNTSETAIMTGTNGVNPSVANIFFTIGNAVALLNSGNTAFSNIGSVFVGINGIDWGLPFYLGRTTYMIFAGESAVINGTNYPASQNGYWIY